MFPPWRICLNLCFLRPTRVHNQNGKSIGLAVSAQLTAESPYTLQGRPFSPKLPIVMGDLDPTNYDSLGYSEISIQYNTNTNKNLYSAKFVDKTRQTACISIQPFSHRRSQSVAIIHYGCPFPKKFPLPMGNLNPI